VGLLWKTVIRQVATQDQDVSLLGSGGNSG
jgi:hypothetical protein